MKKWHKNILFCLVITFSVFMSFELCAFIVFDQQQVIIENFYNDCETDVSGSPGLDADHDDIPGINTNRSAQTIDFMAIRINIPHVFFSGNTSFSVWLPPKLF
jgi:hypothetical protein